jgi:hypothetical protein
VTAIDYRCQPCDVLASDAGLCPFCDLPMTALGSGLRAVITVGNGDPSLVPVTAAGESAPCPDWPDVEPDTADRAPTRTRKPRAPRKATHAR